jgi:hypothetical protein
LTRQSARSRAPVGRVMGGLAIRRHAPIGDPSITGHICGAWARSLYCLMGPSPSSSLGRGAGAPE